MFVWRLKWDESHGFLTVKLDGTAGVAKVAFLLELGQNKCPMVALLFLTLLQPKSLRPQTRSDLSCADLTDRAAVEKHIISLTGCRVESGFVFRKSIQTWTTSLELHRWVDEYLIESRIFIMTGWSVQQITSNSWTVFSVIPYHNRVPVP